MKNFKLIIIVIVFFSSINIQSSGSRTVKIMKPALKTGVIGTEMLVNPTVAEAYQRPVETHRAIKEKHSSEKNNYKGQGYQFNNSQSFYHVPTAVKNNNQFNPSKKSLRADENHSFHETSKPLEQKHFKAPQEQSVYHTQPNKAAINLNAQPPAQAPPLTLPPYFSSSNLGGRFAFKGIPKVQSKPKDGQLLLKYDQNYKNPTQEPVKTIATTKKLNNSPIAEHRIEKIVGKQNKSEPVIEHKDIQSKQSKKSNIITEKQTITEPQIVKEKFDINQMYVDGKVKDLSKFVENWHYYRNDFNTVKSHDNMLQQEFLKSLNIKNKEGKLKVFDAATDFKIIDTLVKKYKKDKNVVRVLQATRETIQHQFTSQQATPRQANSVIAYYYNETMRNDLFSFMNTKPLFDQQSQTITNMPSIESITQKALQNPTAQGYKVLQSALEATNIALYASRADRSFFGDGSLLTQLKTFEKMINTTLQSPQMSGFQSWGSYASQTFLSAGASAFDATIGNMPVSTAINIGKETVKQVSPYAKSLINVSGVKDMTLSQVAEKTGLSPQENRVENNPAPLQPQKSSVKQTFNFDIDPKVVKEVSIKNKSNALVSQYYTPAMQQDIMILTGKNSKNKPKVEDIITKALESPSQASFNALQSALEATRVALYANRSQNSMFVTSSNFKQLQSFESQIIQTLQQPQFVQFHSWSSRATSYATSFIPSVKTVLETTNIGNMTVDQAIQNIQNAHTLAKTTVNVTGLQPIVEKVVNYSGIPNMTVSQGLSAAGITN